jgi:hypothetical protein
MMPVLEPMRGYFGHPLPTTPQVADSLLALIFCLYRNPSMSSYVRMVFVCKHLCTKMVHTPVY